MPTKHPTIPGCTVEEKYPDWDEDLTVIELTIRDNEVVVFTYPDTAHDGSIEVNLRDTEHTATEARALAAMLVAAADALETTAQKGAGDEG